MRQRRPWSKAFDYHFGWDGEIYCSEMDVKSIKYEEEIVNVEKAKKVTADTVRHLSSHTHLIKDNRYRYIQT